MTDQKEIPLARPPLILALVQVQFAPVMMMKKYIPNLQDRFRKDQSYPRYQELSSQQLVFSSSPEVSIKNRWLFGSKSKKNWIIVAEDFVVFETSEYDFFQNFADQLTHALVALSDALKAEGEGQSIAFVNKIGLRFIDLIRPLDGHSPDAFLRPEVRGLSSQDLGATKVTSQMITSITTDEGILNLRAYNGIGQFIPPVGIDFDRHEFSVELKDDESFRILDFDHIWNGEIDFQPEEIADKSKSLHSFIMKTFYAAISDEGLSVWKREEGEG